jgi:queuine tRNA-ribosyltransferase
VKRCLETSHGNLPLPAFLPDGTRGAVRTIDAADLEACGINAFMVNVLHLSVHPGTAAIASLGGIHRFTGWEGPIASDSGGYQAYSLVAGSRKLGGISGNGFTYRFSRDQPKKTLTPEKCIQKQFQLGTDIMFCLDHCTHPSEDRQTQRDSVEHTVAWARRCKEAFKQRVESVKGRRPLLFAVVQGGNDDALRRECAERLVEIGFDGYGFGGWPIDGEGRLVEMVARTAEMLPREAPKHALGIGKPENVVHAFSLGYHLFDCVIPTRDARHRRLYTFTNPPSRLTMNSSDFYTCVSMQDQRYARDSAPVEEGCDCPCCRRYSRAYLYHLFQSNEQGAARLATIHNLRFYARLMAALRDHAPKDGAL